MESIIPQVLTFDFLLAEHIPIFRYTLYNYIKGRVP